MPLALQRRVLPWGERANALSLRCGRLRRLPAQKEGRLESAAGNESKTRCEPPRRPMIPKPALCAKVKKRAEFREKQPDMV